MTLKEQVHTQNSSPIHLSSPLNRPVGQDPHVTPDNGLTLSVQETPS